MTCNIRLRVTEDKPIVTKVTEQIVQGGFTPTGTLDITENGTYNVRQYVSAAVDVPNSYTAADEGKVVDGGELVSQSARTVTENGDYDTTLNNAVSVNVPNPSTGELAISKNGTYDVTDYASAAVNVAGDTSAIAKIASMTATELTAQDLAGVTVWALGYSYNNTIRSIAFPDGLTRITGNFDSDNNLASVTFPTSLQSIGNRTFQGCKALTSVELNEGLTTLGYQIWRNCTSLRTVILPSTLTNSDNSNFNGCTALESIICKAVNPPRIYAAFWDGAPSAVNIYVPAESVDAYKAATGWSARADYIQAITE